VPESWPGPAGCSPWRRSSVVLLSASISPVTASKASRDGSTFCRRNAGEFAVFSLGVRLIDPEDPARMQHLRSSFDSYWHDAQTNAASRPC